MATRLSSPEGFVRGLALALLSAVLVGVVWFAFNRDGSPNGSEPRELTARGPVHTSYVFSAGGGIQPIQFVDSNGKAVFEGDIVLGKTADLLEVARQVDQDRRSKDDPGKQSLVLGWNTIGRSWINGIVPYDDSANGINRQRIQDAIAHWHAVSPIRFTRRTSEREFLRFESTTGTCESPIGRQPANRLLESGSEFRGEIMEAAGKSATEGRA